MKWVIPNINDNYLNNYLNKFNNFKIVKLHINNDNNEYIENNCHNNVNKYINSKNDCTINKILGYYILKHKSKIKLILHSIILENNNLIDITPDSLYNEKLFIYGYFNNYYKEIVFDHNLVITEKTNINTINYINKRLNK